MLVSYFTPLAPAAILLLSAFLLFMALPLLPVRWQEGRGLNYLTAPVLVGVALASLLGIRLSPGGASAGLGPELLSGWDFVTSDSVAALTIRADALSLPFLIITLMLLLAVTLFNPAGRGSSVGRRLPWPPLGWLMMGAAACTLFVSANGLTVTYAVMAFDAFTAFYWWGKGQKTVGVARLFLGIITASSLLLAGTLLASGADTGLFFLGGVLWLRLGAYPLLENHLHTRWPDDERLAYLGLTAIVSLYLAARTIHAPLPEAIRWLAVATALVGGLQSWLSVSRPLPPQASSSRNSLLVWLFFTAFLGVLLTAPLTIDTAAALAVSLVLSLMALWATPALGKPAFGEGAWSWPYLPALMATLTLIGVPFSLGWLTRTAMFTEISRVDGLAMLGVAVIATGLALSGLVDYWRLLSAGHETNFNRAIVGLVAMIPFLTPGLAPFVLLALTGANAFSPDLTQPASVWASLLGSLMVAGAVAWFKAGLLAKLPLSPPILSRGLGFNWLLPYADTGFNRLGKVVLRLQIILEGQHYLGWAMFTALLGLLIILFS